MHLGGHRAITRLAQTDSRLAPGWLGCQQKKNIVFFNSSLMNLPPLPGFDKGLAGVLFNGKEGPPFLRGWPKGRPGLTQQYRYIAGMASPNLSGKKQPQVNNLPGLWPGALGPNLNHSHSLQKVFCGLLDPMMRTRLLLQWLIFPFDYGACPRIFLLRENL